MLPECDVVCGPFIGDRHSRLVAASSSQYDRIVTRGQIMKNLLLAVVATASCCGQATAADDEIELWFSPSVNVALDQRHYVELDTAQRFRGAPAADTYQLRLWLGRKMNKTVTGAFGIERTFEGNRRETRTLQQLSYPLGPLSARTRVEQRFVSDSPRNAWRVRQRLGYSLPLTDDPKHWRLAATIEGFFTLRAGTSEGQTGLTGVRTFVGFDRDWPRFRLSLGYIRNQAVRTNAPDRVAHAPQIGIGFRL